MVLYLLLSPQISRSSSAPHSQLTTLFSTSLRKQEQAEEIFYMILIHLHTFSPVTRDELSMVQPLRLWRHCFNNISLSLFFFLSIIYLSIYLFLSPHQLSPIY